MHPADLLWLVRNQLFPRDGILSLCIHAVLDVARGWDYRIESPDEMDKGFMHLTSKKRPDVYERTNQVEVRTI